MGKGSWLQRLGLVRSPPISLAEFRDRVAKEMARLRPELELRLVDDAEIAWGDGGYVHVGRYYAYWREHPMQLDEFISKMVESVFDEPEPAKPEDLIVLVRPNTFVAGEEGSDDRGLARSLPGLLVAAVAVDTPARYVFSTASQLRKDLDLDDGAIWERAMVNLRQRLDTGPPAYRDGSLMGIKTDIGLASSLLVVDEYWQHAVFTSRGDWVVAPLERDELVAVPFNRPEMVQALRNLVARGPASSDFLCDRLLLRKAGAWHEFE